MVTITTLPTAARGRLFELTVQEEGIGEQVVTATTFASLIDNPALDDFPPHVWDEILAELDIATAAVENGTFALAQQAGLIDIHMSPWEVL